MREAPDALTKIGQLVRAREERVTRQAKLVEDLEESGQRERVTHAKEVLDTLQRGLERAQTALHIERVERAVHHFQLA